MLFDTLFYIHHSLLRKSLLLRYALRSGCRRKINPCNDQIKLLLLLLLLLSSSHSNCFNCFNQHFSPVQFLNASQKDLYHSPIYNPGKLKQSVGEVNCAGPLSWQLKWGFIQMITTSDKPDCLESCSSAQSYLRWRWIAVNMSCWPVSAWHGNVQYCLLCLVSHQPCRCTIAKMCFKIYIFWYLSVN